MKKTTLKNSESLAKRLSKYGALTAAIAGIADASGQIIYTDIADLTIDPTNAREVLDLNNDATGDYLFGVGSGGNFAFIFPVASSMASVYNSNAFVGFLQSGYAYPSNLAAGAAISSANPTFTSQRGDFNYSSCGYPGSQFCDGNDGYIGLHFKIGANTHYGWARIQVAPSGGSIILKDYAYEATADTPIDAGQTLSTNDFDVPIAYQISCNDKWVTISNIQGEANYKVLSISGQTVFTGNTRLESQKIDLNGFASGIYIVEVSNAENSKVKRKKIVLE